ncbi:MAG TPA: hypothetical protein P5125_02260 [Kiritimatiellia bacterium]|jgi:sialate O-acetylesterase|nr:hypothetical protein [Kiritimatiellia bacterium]HRU19157.1 hypothetical protein [Kiritimatiellia bacterium]
MKTLTIVAAVCAPAVLLAGLSVSPVFMDNMILQRDKPIPVWGRGEAGKEVTVDFAGARARATVDADGRWAATLPALGVSNDDRTMTVTMGEKQGFFARLFGCAPEGERVTFANVLVGDVWLCSGQSNMEYSFCWWPYSMDLSKAFCTNTPNFRYLRVARHKAPVPRETPEIQGKWSVLTGQVWFTASCVGCFFAQTVMEKTGKKIPIGLIDSSWGGMNIEPYIDPTCLRDDDPKALKAIKDRYDENANPATAKGRMKWDAYLARQKAFVADIEAAVVDGRPPAGDPAEVPVSHTYWNGCYQAMIHPFAKYPVKGALWYQGCGNYPDNENYQYLLEGLVRGWREAWGYTFPFYWVQLSSFDNKGVVDDAPAGGLGFTRVREGMRRAMATIPHGGMCVTFDLGDPKDIHPREKLHVGQRLAQWALKNEYGFDDIVPSGPNYRAMKIEGDRIRLSFDYVGSGLAVGYKNNFDDRDVKLMPEAKLSGFAIAGEDRTWFFADAVIDGDTVVVSSKDVKKPVAVRYAYRTSPIGANLYNRELLPASPFCTDDWEREKK